MIILWFSCGAASAVACKISLEKHPDARIVYQHIESAHSDNVRFIADCEKWFLAWIQTKNIGQTDYLQTGRHILSLL